MSTETRHRFAEEADGEPKSGLACHTCRRRKIRCDRKLPSCTICFSSAQDCSYPAGPLKPGPRIGTSQRARKRARHNNSESRNASQETGESNKDVSRDASNRGSRAYGAQNEYTDRDSRQLDSYGGSQSQSFQRMGLPSPDATVSTITSLDETGSIKGPALSHIMHPSHDLSSQFPHADDPSYALNQDGQTVMALQMTMQVCNALQISAYTMHFLIESYFQNMTSFSLFNRPQFQAKLLAISSPIQIQALLAAMFSFSARFSTDESIMGRKEDSKSLQIPPPEHFYAIATQLIDEALDDCHDEAPPICLLQALILTTFQQLIAGVHGRAWRSLGTCVRIAYELQLHLIDSDKIENNEANTDAERWSLDEERRRSWWAIWEFDVFASTVRRLPTAIEWNQIETFLPIDDESWFKNEMRTSCRFEVDPTLRWKTLEMSGNKSAKAWFIVVNSIMRNAQILSNPKGQYDTTRNRGNGKGRETAQMNTNRRSSEEVRSGLAILANSLCCYIIALPPSLAYQDEYLQFKASDPGSDRPSRQDDSAKHSIHIMIQLARFMIYQYESFGGNGRESPEGASKGEAQEPGPSGHSQPGNTQKAWNRYLGAADNILALVRNCSANHVKYVNPFLASTIWLAAAAQVVGKTFGLTQSDRRLTDSNLELLRSNFNQYVTFWNALSVLQLKLDTLESHLETLRAQGIKGATTAVTNAGTAGGTATCGSSHHMDTSTRLSGGYDDCSAAIAGFGPMMGDGSASPPPDHVDHNSSDAGPVAYEEGQDSVIMPGVGGLPNHGYFDPAIDSSFNMFGPFSFVLDEFLG